LQSATAGGERDVQRPAGHVNTPWSKPSKTIITFPEHWIDSKHEPEGTGRLLMVTDDVEGKRSCVSVHTGFNIGEDTLRREMKTIIEKYSGYVECWDDVSIMPLDVKLMRAGRDLEMEFFRNIGVWSETHPKATVKGRGGRVIQGRWVDTNNGDPTAPDYRARFVGKEFNTSIGPTLYAATPPLEALKLIMSQASGNRSNGINIMLSDVKGLLPCSRASFCFALSCRVKILGTLRGNALSAVCAWRYMELETQRGYGNNALHNILLTLVSFGVFLTIEYTITVLEVSGFFYTVTTTRPPVRWRNCVG
jgi:hypothetical protein